MSDFFDNHEGNAEPLEARPRWKHRLRDRIYDARVRFGSGLRRIRRQPAPEARVLIVGVEVPDRKADIHRVIRQLADGSRLDVTASVAPMETRGKFENIDAAIGLAPAPLSAFDWLVIVDDDISFKDRFLDDFIAIARAADLSIAQPAHAFESHTTYAITKREWASLVRRTGFVEIGPLTLVRADAFADLIPFPDSRWCYGIDVLWAEIADRRNFRMGVVDATPIRHLRPVAGSYNMDAAIAEGRSLLSRFSVRKNRKDLFGGSEIVVRA